MTQSALARSAFHDTKTVRQPTRLLESIRINDVSLLLLSAFITFAGCQRRSQQDTPFYPLTRNKWVFFLVHRWTQMFTDFFKDVWFEYKISVLICENLWKNSSLPKNDPLVTEYGIFYSG